MSKLHEPEAKLPEVMLEALPVGTKDFLLAHGNQKPIPEVVRDILNRAAESAGFQPEPVAAES